MLAAARMSDRESEFEGVTPFKAIVHRESNV